MESKCIVCGKVFEAKNAKGVLCSSACRTKSSRMRKKSNNASGDILPDEVEFLLLCDGTKLSATRENVQRYFGSWFGVALGSSVVDTKPSIKDAGKMSMLRGLMGAPVVVDTVVVDSVVKDYEDRILRMYEGGDDYTQYDWYELEKSIMGDVLLDVRERRKLILSFKNR